MECVFRRPTTYFPSHLRLFIQYTSYLHIGIDWHSRNSEIVCVMFLLLILCVPYNVVSNGFVNSPYAVWEYAYPI